MPGFLIRNDTEITGLKVFVSKYTNGDDSWYDLPDNFDEDYNAAHWGRNGWEVIVIKDPATGERRGWYVETLEGALRECKFKGFDQEMEFSSRFE